MTESQKPYQKGDQPEVDVAVVPNLDDNNESNYAVDLDTWNLLRQVKGLVIQNRVNVSKSQRRRNKASSGEGMSEKVDAG
ncbi:hypothetical protein AAHA92_25518 [Salvia divinorum]|uniref:Uncharacterized protein n=1 Tax=Salvia divinorum TaxID=28513 RepID=A0ABD1GB42_SALDI